MLNRFNFLSLKTSKLNSELVSGDIDTHKILFAKPQTFMNLSGSAIGSICSYYKIELKSIIVIHDDIDLPVGKLRFKLGGGNGGHNGLRSIDQHMGKEYHRLKIGVGRPENINIDIADYVLGNFTADEYKQIINSINIVKINFELILSGKLEEFKKNIS
jgi:PTH1 family peptidyl-tRNA hydrolase